MTTLDLLAARSAISAAVNVALGADGKCTPNYRQITRPGDCFVRFAGAVRDVTGFGFIVTYEILIAVPQEIKAAEVWVDTHAGDVIDGASSEIIVTAADPIELQLDAGSTSALRITGTRPA